MKIIIEDNNVQAASRRVKEPKAKKEGKPKGKKMFGKKDTSTLGRAKMKGPEQVPDLAEKDVGEADFPETSYNTEPEVLLTGTSEQISDGYSMPLGGKAGEFAGLSDGSPAEAAEQSTPPSAVEPAAADTPDRAAYVTVTASVPAGEVPPSKNEGAREDSAFEVPVELEVGVDGDVRDDEAFNGTTPAPADEDEEPCHRSKKATRRAPIAKEKHSKKSKQDKLTKLPKAPKAKKPREEKGIPIVVTVLCALVLGALSTLAGLQGASFYLSQLMAKALGG